MKLPSSFIYLGSSLTFGGLKFYLGNHTVQRLKESLEVILTKLILRMRRVGEVDVFPKVTQT